ncbi:hypothetical protein [Paenibacillus wynnii]|uniref:Uncharacterized protein n=1 Tax=Paenibacillus wynnii TaxID=268407 RepID=A0A098M6Q0_9BACL|nr:hypothetical protein [Paenibacillus wynnii]KGE17708.1 hypothetical protein PWYN_24365 [Paenibacillus wynnii]
MNRKIMFKSAVLSALLVSAVTGSLIANASDVPQDSQESLTVSSTKAIAVPMFSMIDPLDAAKKYAPDTVLDWKTTLAKYTELIPQAVDFGEEGIAVKAVPSVDVVKEGLLEIEFIEAKLTEENYLGEAPIAVGAVRGTPADVVMTLNEAGPKNIAVYAATTKDDVANSAFFSAQIELNQVNESRMQPLSNYHLPSCWSNTNSKLLSGKHFNKRFEGAAPKSSRIELDTRCGRSANGPLLQPLCSPDFFYSPYR